MLFYLPDFALIYGNPCLMPMNAKFRRSFSKNIVATQRMLLHIKYDRSARLFWVMFKTFICEMMQWEIVYLHQGIAGTIM